MWTLNKSGLVAAAFLLAFATSASALTPDEIARADEAIGSDLGRYMQEGARLVTPCTNAKLRSWNLYPVVRCVYTSATSEKSHLVVFLLKTPRSTFARWIASSCAAARLRNDPQCLANMAKKIRGASGFQFAVSGLVDESDSSSVCRSGRCFFTFRDGVAVNVSGLDAFKQNAGERALQTFDIRTQEQLAKIGAFDRPGEFARIASTSVSDLITWLKQNPKDRPPGLSRAAYDWLDRQINGVVADTAWQYPEVIRVVHQAAWRSDRNILIDAWASTHRACLASPFGCPQ